jgi:hypothetical protein
MRLALFIVMALVPAGSTWAGELATTETQVGRLALPVVPDSLVVAPDSSRLVLAAKSGDATLEDKGIFINPNPTNPLDDSARTLVNPICLYIDDKPTIPFDSTSLPVFSPDSRRLAYAGRHGKTWQLVLDGKTLIPDADDVPPQPVAFSPDSAHVAWAVKKGEQFLVTVDDTRWPPLNAVALGKLEFSPDSQHVAAVARIATGWTIFVDGAALPAPTRPSAPPSPTTRRTPGAALPTAPPPLLVRFGQFQWRPDARGLVYYAAFAGSSWQVFGQMLDGSFGPTSQRYDAILNGAPWFSPDGRRMAFAASTRNKWAMLTDPAPATSTSPATPPPPAFPFDQILSESISYCRPSDAPNAPFTLLYLAQQNKKWRLFANDQPQADAFDAIIQNSFVVSPDRHHYAFAGTRDGQTLVIRDGRTLAAHNECAASSFAFSPDSQHLVYAARNSVNWFACIDGTPGKPFNMMTNTPIAFAPDSSRIAFMAMTAPKSWRVIVGKDGEFESKPYDAFLKGARVHWRADGTLVTIAIQKKVALRVEAKP